MIENVINSLNQSPIFVALAMIFMNLGAKHIIKDIPPWWDNLFENVMFRRLAIFALAFIATRDIKIALIVTFIFIAIFGFLFNENSNAYILN